MPARKILLGLCVLMSFATGAWAGEVLVARVDGIIGPITARFMVQAIDRAEKANVECLVFELDTPGGLDDSMRTIIKRIMGSKGPVVVYVAPAGSRAASAGAFITLSAHVAAMAPGTTIGAAHPVSFGQSLNTDSNMSAKVTNDSAAYMRSIAEKRGHNKEWAEAAVRESVSLMETEALSNKVVDLIAPSTTALLAALDGRVLTNGLAAAVTLRTKGATVTNVAMNWHDSFLSMLANPNVAYILFLLGLLGLYFELSTPGAILPGVVGVISLVLAFFAFQTLPVNYAGVVLIIVATILFILDVKAATHGVLTIGGLVAMFIGSMMLFQAPDPALRVSLQVIIPAVLATGAFFVLGIGLALKDMRRRTVVGDKGLLNQEGDARAPVGPNGGTVFVAGTHWNAVAGTDIPQGAKIRVVEVKDMTLTVEQTN